MAITRQVNGSWVDVDFTGTRLVNGVWVEGGASAGTGVDAEAASLTLNTYQANASVSTQAPLVLYTRPGLSQTQ